MNKHNTCRILAFALFCLLLINTAMAAEDSEAGSHRNPSPDGARVWIANVEDGGVVPLMFLLQFSVSGMGIAPAGSDIPNTGHHHLVIDVTELPDPNLPLPKNENFIHYGAGQTEAEITLPAGQHTLQLVFADYAHIPHNPVVKSTPITITVSADAEVLEMAPDDEP